ncbi:PQQ-binding-like beta-propeller repeat protein [Alienimonas sp. DA493]|uniref:outer membrane protein assembly factor BamB family protein n=1 Tax=Alienimonas sp. DA493 TaxID=3373605 RepID=UPI0037545036
MPPRSRFSLAALSPLALLTLALPAPALAQDGAAQVVEDPAAAVARWTADGDWPMWGGDPFRNMVNAAPTVNADFQPETRRKEAKNVLWTAPLGSQTYGNPVVGGGKVLVGTNNGGEYRPQHVGDRGVVLCFDENDGSFLWQLTREKLPQGRVHDWPEQGICSTPVIEGDRVWVITNRCEVMCLDLDGFRDGTNDGDYQDEVDAEKEDADILWSLDMIEELGVFPHNLATSSPLILGDNLYFLTSNGVDEAHLEVPAPRAPCFLCLNKNTGEIVWEDNTPFDNILHGQWSSPCVAIVDGQAQVLFPGGDGILYAMDPAGDGDGGGKILWQFDLNPKDSYWELGGRGTRNAVIATPVFADGYVYVGVGQDPEHGEGVGHFYKIDPTGSGDVSPTLMEDDKIVPNPNSKQVWHYGGEDTDGSVTGSKGELIYRRTMSTVAVHDGLVIAPDLSGFVHCLDAETGKRLWVYDMFAACWGSPMVADGKIFVGDEDGDLTVMELGREENVIEEKMFSSSVYSTPTIAHGKMFVSDRSRLYCFDVDGE